MKILVIADENLKRKKENEAESRNIWVVKQQDLVISWAFVTGLSFRMPMN